MQHRPMGGMYECKLDNRFRIAIPSRVRARFQDSGVVVARWFDGCLIAVPVPEWPTFLDSLFGELNVLDQKSRDLQRFVLGGSVDQDLDKQGRVPLPAHLRSHAAIDMTATVIGNGDYLEIWSPQRIEERLATMEGGGVEEYARDLADGRS